MEKKITNKIKLDEKLNEVLLWILLFFGLFDTARNYTYLPISFGYLKDIAVYLLFFFNIGKIKLHKSLGFCFYIWFIIVLLGSPFGFLFSKDNRITILIACFKYIEFFLLIFIFTNWNRFFRLDMKKFIRRYVYGSLILCFVNVFGYFVDNPIVSRALANANMNPDLYGGRITVGQPAIAIFPVIISFFFLLTTKEKRKLDKWLIVVFFICIVIATSNTGIVSVFFCLLVIFFYGLFLTRNNRIKKRLLFFVIVGFAGFIFLLLIKSEVVSKILVFYSDKIGRYFLGSTDSMMDLRYSHWKEALASMEPFNYILGRGAYGYIVGNEEFPIENTYRITFLMYGVIGECAMLCFLVQWLIKIGNLIISKKSIGLFGICALATYLFHMYTLDFYLVYTLYFSFALLYSYTLQIDNSFYCMKVTL